MGVYFKVPVLCYCGHLCSRGSGELIVKFEGEEGGYISRDWRIEYFDKNLPVPLVELCYNCQRADYDRQQDFRANHNLGGPL